MVTQLTKQETDRINLSTRMARLAVDSLGADETEPFDDSGCKTPKDVQHRIPPPETCPPAPRKRKALFSDGGLRSGKMEFLEPPELETLFAPNVQVLPKEPE